MREATDIGRDDHLRRPRLQMTQLAGAQLLRQIGLQQGIRAGRAAAQMRFSHWQQFGAAGGEQRLDDAAHLLAMLQGAGRMKADALGHARCARRSRAARRQGIALGGEVLGQITRERHHPLGFA